MICFNVFKMRLDSKELNVRATYWLYVEERLIGSPFLDLTMAKAHGEEAAQRGARRVRIEVMPSHVPNALELYGYRFDHELAARSDDPWVRTSPPYIEDEAA